MKRVLIAALGFVVALSVSSAYANDGCRRVDDQACLHPCSAAAKAAGTCKDYRLTDGSCYQRVCSTGSSSSSSVASSSSSSASSGNVARVGISIVSSSATTIALRCIAYSGTSGQGRVSGAAVHARVNVPGSTTNFRDYGRARTTDSKGLATISGPRSSGETCFKCATGTSGKGVHEASACIR